jgi:hypothetical protein
MEDENCFVIQDLNTTNGTYINDCRVQNAAVRLAEQDIVRFGLNSMPFQFIMQQQHQQSQFITSIPPINLSGSTTLQRMQPLQLISQTVPSRANSNGNMVGQSFWLNGGGNPLPNASLITINNQLPNGGPMKPPAALRTRPSSTNSLNRSGVNVNNGKSGVWTKSFASNNTQQSGASFPLPVVDSETYRQVLYALKSIYTNWLFTILRTVFSLDYIKKNLEFILGIYLLSF